MMQNDLTPFQRALLDAVSEQFREIPPEEEIDLIPSAGFSKKSRPAAHTVRRVCLIAATLALLIGSAFAIAGMRRRTGGISVDRTQTEDGRYLHELSFDESFAAPDAPENIETFYLPAYRAGAEELRSGWVTEDCTSAQFDWYNGEKGQLSFRQVPAKTLSPDYPFSSVLRESAEATTELTTRELGDYEVVCVSLQEGVSEWREWYWTDYHYLFELSCSEGYTDAEMEQVFASVAPVEDVTRYLRRPYDLLYCLPTDSNAFGSLPLLLTTYLPDTDGLGLTQTTGVLSERFDRAEFAWTTESGGQLTFRQMLAQDYTEGCGMPTSPGAELRTEYTELSIDPADETEPRRSYEVAIVSLCRGETVLYRAWYWSTGHYVLCLGADEAVPEQTLRTLFERVRTVSDLSPYLTVSPERSPQFPAGGELPYCLPDAQALGLRLDKYYIAEDCACTCWLTQDGEQICLVQRSGGSGTNLILPNLEFESSFSQSDETRTLDGLRAIWITNNQGHPLRGDVRPVVRQLAVFVGSAYTVSIWADAGISEAELEAFYHSLSPCGEN